MMTITDRLELDDMRLTLIGRLDIHARKTFFTRIEYALSTNPNHITFDFTDVSFMDSSGLGMMMLAKRKFKDPNRQLTLVVPKGNVKKVMDLCRMEQQFTIVES